MNDSLKSMALRFFQFLPRAKKTLWIWKFDLFLLFSSALCFGLFVERSLNLDQMSGIGGPIALMTQGNAERKASGTNLFVDIGPNSNLFNLDAVWVGKNNEATIQLEDKSSIKLAEKTLLILKRPFKHKRGQSSLDEGIKVVKGKVQTTEGKVLTPAVEILLPVAPDAPKDKEVPIELYPKDNSSIYMRPEKDIPLTFAWPTPMTGYIVIQDRLTGRRIYSEVLNQRHFAAKLEQPGSYFWQIIDSDRRPMLGPYTFALKHLDEETAKKLLKSGPADPSKPVEVYW